MGRNDTGINWPLCPTCATEVDEVVNPRTRDKWWACPECGWNNRETSSVNWDLLGIAVALALVAVVLVFGGSMGTKGLILANIAIWGWVFRKIADKRGWWEP